MEDMIQLNEDHEHSLSREELIGMLDELMDKQTTAKDPGSSDCQNPACFCESSYIFVRNERIAGSASVLVISF